MKKLVCFILMFFVGIMVISADTDVQKVDFVRCVDGDTAVFKVDGEEIKFRFLAIDTPETVHPTQEAEAFGKNASEYTCNKLSNANSIVVEYENSNKKDKYGRYLGWIWVDGILLQKELISVGYAQVAYIYGTYRYTESLCLVQKKAKAANLGLWQDNYEEGYCSTIDLTNVEDIINYDNITNNSGETITEEEKELIGVLESLDNITKKVSSFSRNNNDLISNIYLYLMLGAAVISIIFKSIKK
ncbi:MAG: thermonuclease family protein [Firmicutes bacterium]|nr:thermonuclease family protein [Bacillota bacterium]